MNVSDTFFIPTCKRHKLEYGNKAEKKNSFQEQSSLQPNEECRKDTPTTNKLTVIT